MRVELESLRKSNQQTTLKLDTLTLKNDSQKEEIERYKRTIELNKESNKLEIENLTIHCENLTRQIDNLLKKQKENDFNIRQAEVINKENEKVHIDVIYIIKIIIIYYY